VKIFSKTRLTPAADRDTVLTSKDEKRKTKGSKMRKREKIRKAKTQLVAARKALFEASAALKTSSKIAAVKHGKIRDNACQAAHKTFSASYMKETKGQRKAFDLALQAFKDSNCELFDVSL